MASRLFSSTRQYLVVTLLALTCLPALANVEVTKSPRDDRAYEAFELPNRLKVLLISDHRTDKAAAAMDVAVGSSSDPQNRLGLAHFLEHMLFLGTEKYPQAGEYQSFISAHNGSHNAYTAFQNTNYFFDVDSKHLEPALDRFAQFFVAPLFTPDYVAREKNSVDSEYQSKKQSDGWRSLDAEKQVYNPEHPYSRFNVGSLETLDDREDDQIRDELIRFYQQHYSANQMALVVVGREPLTTLRRWVTEKFAGVIDRNVQQRAIVEPLYAPGTLPRRLNVIPVKARRTLSLKFPVPPLQPHYRSKPSFYIGNLIGHEGKGSLLSLLKKKGWVDSLGAGLDVNHREEAVFELSIGLTAAGLGHIDDIAAQVFQYLRLIRASGIEKRYFTEQKTMAELDFMFRERVAPIQLASGLASSLQVYPMADVLRAPYSFDIFDQELIEEFLDRITPENVLVAVSAKELATLSETSSAEINKKSTWFGAEYGITDISSDTLARWKNEKTDPALIVPPANPFLPEDISVKPLGPVSHVPELIEKNDGIEVWFKQDYSYRLPRADFFFSVRSRAANDTPEHTVLSELYVALVDDQLREYYYPATLAGLSYTLYKHVRGFTVRISGYDDKQATLLDRLTKTLKRPEIREERFGIFKEELLRSLNNTKRDTPYHQTISEVSTLLMRPSWTTDQRIAALEPLTAEDLRRFAPKLLEGVSVAVLSHGNVHREDALELSRILQQNLLDEAVAVAVPSARVLKLDRGQHYRRELEVDHADSAVTHYYQGGDNDFSTRANFALLSQVLDAPFYHAIRTQKQRGYVVFATPMTILEAPGLGFVVQSPSTPPDELVSDIETFLSDYRTTLTAMPDESFDEQKRSVMSRILQAEENLAARSDRYWQEIDRMRYRFASRERLTATVQRITRQDFLDFFDRTVLGAERRTIAVSSTSKRHRTANMAKTTPENLIEDRNLFSKNRAFFSSFAPSTNQLDTINAVK